MPELSPCPYLPPAGEGMSWRSLAPYREKQGGAFYRLALCYAQHLWQRGLSARSLLAVDRALYAGLSGQEPELHEWPLPYRAVVWIILHNPPGTFIGNPRVHFQHLADRVRGEREQQKRWRTWACWRLVREACPDLPGDPKHDVTEPDTTKIIEQLTAHGIPGEAAQWRDDLAAVSAMIKAAQP